MVILQYPLALVLLVLIPVLSLSAWRLVPRIGRARAVASWAVRSVVVALLALALAQPLLPRGSSDVTVAIVVDRSRSVSEAGLDSALVWLDEALQGSERQAGDRIAVIHVAAQAVPGAMPDAASEVSLDISPGRRDATNLNRGIELARAILPRDTRSRLLLLSDGLDTAGTLSAAEASDVPVDVLVLPVDRERDVRIERITSPARAPAGSVIEMDLVIAAASEATGRIVVRRNGVPVPLGDDRRIDGLGVTLPSGTTVIPLQVIAGEDLTRLEATWIPDVRDGDPPENDRGRAVVLAARTGTVMLVGEQPNTLEGLKAALSGSGLDVRMGTPSDLAQGGASLAAIDGLALVDVPRWSLPGSFDALLASWVESSGGGLLMTGGASALGAGGWIGSELERVLPVHLDPPAQRQIQRGALVLVMHSCEMERGNHWGRVICETAIEALSAEDLVGIVEYSPSAGGVSWALPIAPAGDKLAALAAASRLRYGDMPDFAPSMQEAVDALEAADAGQKHMVIISDGDPQPPSPALLDRMRDLDIPATTVLVGGHGRSEDRRRMERIAVATGGVFHRVTSPEQLPEIMIEAAQLASRNLVQEEVAPVAVTAAAPGPLAGLSTPPPIDAWVVMAPRESPASTPWIVDGREGRDPMVAWWHHGNGRAAVIAVPPNAGWTPQWTAWTDHDLLWVHLVRWLRPSPDDGAWALQLREGDGGRVEVTLEAAAESTQGLLPSTRAVVLSPDGRSHELDLRPTGPGRAAGAFTMDMPGEWITVAAVDVPGTQRPVFLKAARAQAWPDEDRARAPDARALQRLADATGGRVHALHAPPLEAGLFDREGLDQLVSPGAAWPWLVIAAAILLPIDVAVRRLVLRQDRSTITPAPGPQQSQRTPAAAAPETPAPPWAPSEPAPPSRSAEPSGQAPDSKGESDDAMARLREARRRGRGREDDVS